MTIDDGTVALAQIIFYGVSPLVTLLAVVIAYLALAKQSKPSILIHYRPNPDIQSIIDLVIENVGSGMARDVAFSKPLPARCYGIEDPDGPGFEVLGDGLPAIAVGQKYIFDGGQYGGLSEKLGSQLEIEVSYKYKSPLGISLNRKEACVLSVSHLKYMTTRMSAEQAIVDALKGPNKTTLQRMESEMKNIGVAIGDLTNKISKSSGAEGS
ncbi:hypothetical protein [Alcanivorax sp.]|uniref:hypothetical protein n=1 Tax=Alcanivorax sp. TaxID=1872427 RepID=UPI002B275219|nr:hypothetical protein [Alcanivorax sp.]